MLPRMTDSQRVNSVPPVTEVAPARAIHATVEQLDLYEQVLEDGRHPAEVPHVELVTTLTEDEIAQIDARLPAGSGVAAIVGRALEYHPAGERRRVRSPAAGDGHLDVDA
jgi:hypothetical protein